MLQTIANCKPYWRHSYTVLHKGSADIHQASYKFASLNKPNLRINTPSSLASPRNSLDVTSHRRVCVVMFLQNDSLSGSADNLRPTPDFRCRRRRLRKIAPDTHLLNKQPATAPRCFSGASDLHNIATGCSSKETQEHAPEMIFTSATTAYLPPSSADR
jgi:hypothetical protein